jgi:uncharacterized protein YhbP (UPF0306 family)
MSATLSDRVVAYLDGHTTLNLATTGPAGLWAAAVLYVHDRGRLYFTSVASTRHGQNIAATGVGAGTINDDCTSWMTMKGVQLECAIEPVAEHDELLRIATQYLRRFPYAAALWDGVTDPAVVAADPGIHGFFRITPSRMFFMDNEHSPGRREEVTLPRVSAPA